jgi:hypothetical protein
MPRSSQRASNVSDSPAFFNESHFGRCGDGLRSSCTSEEAWLTLAEQPEQLLPQPLGDLAATNAQQRRARPASAARTMASVTTLCQSTAMEGISIICSPPFQPMRMPI